MSNSITYKRPESDYETILVPDGTYEAICVGHYPRPKAWKDEPAVPGIVFKYVIDFGEEMGATEFKRHVAIATGDRAILKKDMVAIHGEKAWERALLNDGTFSALIDATIDQPVLLQLKTVTTKRGSQFSSIAAVMPPMKPKGQGATVAKRQVPTYGTGRDSQPQAQPAMGGGTQYSFVGVPAGIKNHAEKFLAEQGATYDANTSRWISSTRYEKLREYEVGKAIDPVKQAMADDDIPF